MQSQNQKIQDLSAGLHRMEEMMSHRMEEMMSQMMELMKPSQGKGKEPVVPETQSNVNGTRVNPIEIGANSNEGRGILPLPKGKENGDSGNSSQGHKSSCNLRNSAMKLKRRRREREENAGLASGKIGGADNKHAHELKQENWFVMVNISGEEKRISLIPITVSGIFAFEQKQLSWVSLILSCNNFPNVIRASEFADRSGRPSQQSQPGLAGNAGVDIEKGHAIGQHEEETQKFSKIRIRTLFPDNHKYVWSGPRALVQREGSRRRSCIDAAIEF
ncbi:hypothetical protein GH714_021928 [Hevea brasiliensis]|uniref:Uncharacterized protein n=1 Tax=Hevea brasiliensis TaxID=3981 RepID=A0A6A6N3W4_HEVBR|nr:hypothetical protein GH714_021928 [Hevea brasiliensis]